VKTAIAGAPSSLVVLEDPIALVFFRAFYVKTRVMLFSFFLESLMLSVPTALIFNGIQALQGLSMLKSAPSA
jgi:hypothetical protein